MGLLKTKDQPLQANLFDFEDNGTKPTVSGSREELGTFKDSLRAPIHRWFTYPAGFSYKAVEEAFRRYNIQPGMTVFDPFAGTGTTNVVAKQQGINSFGIEAHPFVHFVASAKLFWEYDKAGLFAFIQDFMEILARKRHQADLSAIPLDEIFPELVRKCYSPDKLACLYVMREEVGNIENPRFRDLCKLALTNLLRSVADVATGWPYIAPGKARQANHVDVLAKYREQLHLMYSDLCGVIGKTPPCSAEIIFGDARQRHYRDNLSDGADIIQTASVDLAFTSPPYLNNYDYADRTRLETYFFGETVSWGDITSKIRTRLMMSATTQINRNNYNKDDLLDSSFKETCPQITDELDRKIKELSVRRLGKGGKKSYDILVAGYFNDMFKVLQETYRVLKDDTFFILILGDSAPYGVYIPTDNYLGEIGRSIGFRGYEIDVLRKRGDKWKENPQRHREELRESMLILQK